MKVSGYTVPKKFPNLPGKIEKFKISKQFWKQFSVVLVILTGPIFPSSSGNSSRKFHGSFGDISKAVNHSLEA
jgi:hypothetical protein